MSLKNKDEEKGAKEAPKMTPLEYRDRFCMVQSRAPLGGRSVSVGYAVADALYRWSQQAHHYGAESFQLTKEQFDAAVSAALAFPVQAPLEVAIPPAAKDKFKNFKPKKKAK